MYSGTTFNRTSGRVFGAHQKIDRLARASLNALIADKSMFPSAREILHFEGMNGPDAIKVKSPAKDEPWHFFSPFDDQDTRLMDLISYHYDRLVLALKAQDDVRASFEAAWLAHALVDGLTPAHHYPYEEKLAELRGGEGIETRTTYKGKLLMPGDNRREKVHNNWKMWGAKGLLSTHLSFELGAAGLIAPMTSRRLRASEEDLTELYDHGVLQLFQRKAKEVASLDMYEEYYRTGWTPRLARMVRGKLLPAMVQTVMLAWYAALIDAGLVEKRT